MSDFEKIKDVLIKNVTMLCAHCVSGIEHQCKIQRISAQISDLKGIPLIVNDEFKGILIR